MRASGVPHALALCACLLLHVYFLHKAKRDETAVPLCGELIPCVLCFVMNSLCQILADKSVIAKYSHSGAQVEVARAQALSDRSIASL